MMQAGLVSSHFGEVSADIDGSIERVYGPTDNLNNELKTIEKRIDDVQKQQ